MGGEISKTGGVMNKLYLVRFVYDHYCQGYEDATRTMLVMARDYDDAIAKIREHFRGARHFENLTIPQIGVIWPK